MRNKILKSVLILMALCTVLSGCASSSNNNDNKASYPNLVELHPPQNQPHQPSKVYVDSVKQITWNQHPALLIHGTFPDGCTKLEKASHHISADSLTLTLFAWRNTEKMCTQALTPFSFIYEKLNQEQLSSNSQVIINGSTFKY